MVVLVQPAFCLARSLNAVALPYVVMVIALGVIVVVTVVGAEQVVMVEVTVFAFVLVLVGSARPVQRVEGL